ncbi:MAG TPA: TAXI family TRAP transporter solute-binding subunit [Elusimicrobiales bacterium]|nr:TAXI family TRAP transporter solute-binding subunit [Elusimicrobiales bacterium]
MKKIILPVVFLFLAGCSSKQGTQFVTIGTGAITGLYYPTGGAIAKMINDKKDIYKLSVSVQATGGSVFNANAIMNGDLDFGVVQSDRQYQAVKGLAEWKDKGPQKNIRAVFSIHTEAVTLVSAVDSGINSVKDLRGKRVNIGNHGSGQRQNAIDALNACGLDFKKDLSAESVKASEAAKLLQDDRIDAFFYTVGHPSGAIKESTAGVRKVKFVPITKTDKLLAKYPYYASVKIPIKLYPSATNTKDVETFGVKATFVTSAKVSEAVVYKLTKEIFENFDKFKTLHPAYANLTKEDMLKSLSAPLHPGAIRYYKESGLIK